VTICCYYFQEEKSKEITTNTNISVSKYITRKIRIQGMYSTAAEGSWICRAFRVGVTTSEETAGVEIVAENALHIRLPPAVLL
jgi:hypothetical protein